jgi:hypothetical protein
VAAAVLALLAVSTAVVAIRHLRDPAGAAGPDTGLGTPLRAYAGCSR